MTSRSVTRRLAAIEERVLGHVGEPKATFLVIGDDESRADQIRAAEAEHGADNVMVIHIVTGVPRHQKKETDHA